MTDSSVSEVLAPGGEEPTGPVDTEIEASPSKDAERLGRTFYKTPPNPFERTEVGKLTYLYLVFMLVVLVFYGVANAGILQILFYPISTVLIASSIRFIWEFIATLVE